MILSLSASSAVAFGPMYASAGSLGITRASVKVIKLAPNRTSSAEDKRLRKIFMSSSPFHSFDSEI